MIVSAGEAAAEGPAPGTSVLSVLRVKAFRRLYAALALSSVGDWLGLLAMTALAANLAGGTGAAANYALGGVLVLRLIPAVLFGPFAGAFADRFDRRRTMVVSDVLRCALYASIPLFETLVWVLVVSFLVEVVTLFWMPAKEASVPNLVAPRQLESANQLSLATAYGLAPVIAAVTFAGLAGLSSQLADSISFFAAKPVDLAILLNAATFGVSALIVVGIHEISGRAESKDGEVAPGLIRSVREGWSFIARTRFVRGLVIGILGSFAAAGVLIGVSRQFAVALGGADATYGLLFGAMFVGLGLGVVVAPLLERRLPASRLFGFGLAWSSVMLSATAFVTAIPVGLVFVALIGLGAGVAFLLGLTIIGRDVEDWVRGRTFAFVFSATRIILIFTLATVPFAVGALTGNVVSIGPIEATLDGARVVAFLAGLVNAGIALVSLRLMGSLEGRSA